MKKKVIKLVKEVDEKHISFKVIEKFQKSLIEIDEELDEFFKNSEEVVDKKNPD